MIAGSHGRRTVRLVEGPCFGQSMRVVWRKRTWECKEPDIENLCWLVVSRFKRAALAVDDRRHKEGESLRKLLPDVRYDFHDVAQVDGRIETYAQVDKPVMLLSGTRSPAFLRQAVRELRSTLPRSTHVELDGLDGPWNNGSPTAVGAAIGEHLVKTK